MTKLVSLQLESVDHYSVDEEQRYQSYRRDFEQKRAYFLLKQQEFEQRLQVFQEHTAYLSQLHQELCWAREDIDRYSQEQKRMRYLRRIVY